MNKEYLEITEQLELFKKRGMIIENEEKALEKLVFINYYKLKEALFPFFFENKICNFLNVKCNKKMFNKIIQKK